MKKWLIAIVAVMLVASPTLAKEQQQTPPNPQKQEDKQQQKHDQKQSEKGKQKPQQNKDKKQQEKNKQKPEPKKDQKQQSQVDIPDSVIDISKENTYPNPSNDEPELQPSDLTQNLLKTTKIEIENTRLIHLFNESNINNSKLTLGYRANIYLGEWPLNYQSTKTNVNWEYEKVNVNQIDNRGGNERQTMSYTQEKQAKVRGGLTANIPHAKEVKKLMMLEAAENTGLPIAFETFVGKGTKAERIYHVEPKKVGYLSTYVPAVNEKGKVTYGEVYLVLKGDRATIKVKNVTQQGIGAWIPVQDHISLRYHVNQ